MNKITYHQIKDFLVPKNNYVYKESFFIVKDGQFLIVGQSSLQCNDNEAISQLVKDKLYPDHQVVKLQLYLPQNLVL